VTLAQRRLTACRCGTKVSNRLQAATRLPRRHGRWGAVQRLPTLLPAARVAGSDCKRSVATQPSDEQLGQEPVVQRRPRRPTDRPRPANLRTRGPDRHHSGWERLQPRG
jgi:hypothetical protein